MKSILNNRWLQGALSFILSFSMLYYEIRHGVRNPWWTGMFIGCVLGLLYEDIRATFANEIYNPINIWPWFMGGLISCMAYSVMLPHV